jgi:MYXO-CTERM domain-containing protein
LTDDPGTATADDPTSFTAVDVTPPSVTITPVVTATSGTHIQFTVVFSEPVTGFTSDDVVIDGTAGADTAVVSGSGANYTVTVSGMTGSGTVTALIPAGAAQDASGNLNLVSGTTPASVRFTELPSLAITGVDPAPGAAMALLFLALGGALLIRRRIAA